jgi:RNA polymerase sigma-70 factor (ECF subfamily)
VTGHDPPGEQPADLLKSEDVPAQELAVLRKGLRLLALRSLRDVDLAEEAAQETLARTLAALRSGQVHDPTHLGAFARGIACHVIADLHRARQRTTPLDEFPGAADPPTADPDALQLIVSEEQNERLRAALVALSAADRELLRLSFFEGLTPLEVAERLGEPATRIRKRKSRALERLRRALEERGLGSHDRLPRPTTP